MDMEEITVLLLVHKMTAFSDLVRALILEDDWIVSAMKSKLMKVRKTPPPLERSY